MEKFNWNNVFVFSCQEFEEEIDVNCISVKYEATDS